MATTLPTITPLAMPFANNGTKNTIPDSATGTGRASLTEGFPPITQTPIAEGGIPPSRADFNGILNIATMLPFFLQQGGYYTFDATVSTLIGGYPENALLYYLDSSGSLHLLRSTKINNTDNFITTPSVIGSSWVDITPGADLVNEHNQDPDAHQTGIAGKARSADKLAATRNIFGHPFNGTADVTGWVYSDVGMIIGKTIKVNMTNGKFRVYFEEEENPLGDVGSGEILTYDPATGVLNCVSFTGKAMIAADGNATASQTFVNNKLVRSLATFGYLNCNGVLMQWGSTQMVGLTQSVSFPTTYPNDCVSIQATIYGSDESGDVNPITIDSKTNSGFVMRAPNATLKPIVTWFTTGY